MHARTCCVAPWYADATALAHEFECISAAAPLDRLVRCRMTTFWVPRTLWRMLIQEDLRRRQGALRGTDRTTNGKLVSDKRLRPAVAWLRLPAPRAAARVHYRRELLFITI